MNDVSQLVIAVDNYDSEQDYQIALMTAVDLLLNANYIVTARYDAGEKGIVVLDYAPADESWGSPYPYWLTPEEADLITDRRYSKQVEPFCPQDVCPDPDELCCVFTERSAEKEFGGVYGGEHMEGGILQ